ncbi:hypothetical protein K7B10_04160 [Streptomyces flavotricini]|uniref:Uncharacterized protein n=1 Tax=Streptomyces flavotricini TaxID=66888 RepID=A0ABS8DZC2_9ACTN|nr:hypothetical protein [Streptomyces flavotricini]MCC0093994.1 hypothetical protein [Streptomyces flavotricini]
MEDQGGAGGVPLHGHGDEERRRAPHAGKDGHAVRAADTDEASRLDRPGQSSKKGPGPVREIPHGESSE